MSDEDEGCVVRLRGLPWSATQDDVLKFFEGVELADDEESGIHFTFSREGRPSGEAFVEFLNEEELEKGLKRNNADMGQRYIEVFRSKKSEMDWVIKRAGPNQSSSSTEAVVRLRGLPFGCSKEEIAQFFTGLEIVPNGIMLPEDRQGRSTGEAFVQFARPDIAEKALLKHKERIGHRYIEIFKSSTSEANGIMSRVRPLLSMGGGGPGMGRPGPYDRGDRFGMGGGGMGGGMGMGGGYNRGRGGRNLKGFFDDDDFDDYGGGYGGFGGNRRGNMRNMRGGSGGGFGGRMGGGMQRNRGETPGSHHMSGTGHSVHMRGLPFQAIDQDVVDFFAPIRPVNVEFEFAPNGKSTGEANVDFNSHQDAVAAMKKHKSYMQQRYIELFLNSTTMGNGSGNFGGGGGGGGGMGMNNMGGGGGGGYGSGMGGGGYNQGQPESSPELNSSGGGGYMSGGGGGGGYNQGGGGGGYNQGYNQGGGGGYNQGGGGGMGGGMGGGGGWGDGGGGMSNNYMGNQNYTAF